MFEKAGGGLQEGTYILAKALLEGHGGHLAFLAAFLNFQSYARRNMIDIIGTVSLVILLLLGVQRSLTCHGGQNVNAVEEKRISAHEETATLSRYGENVALNGVSIFLKPRPNDLAA